MTVRIIEGDVRERLAELPAGSVQCCVTSPPYFGLRDYGVAGQIGLEPTLAEYIETMVAVMGEVSRVLRDDGTLFLNIGDSYFGTGKGPTPPTGFHRANGSIFYPTKGAYTHETLKPKDLMMVPARLALALQDDGWYLRSDIIWHKPNPMPESVTDRPTSAHEHIFLLTKSRRYYYDADAIRQPAVDERPLSSWGERKARGEPIRRGDPGVSGHVNTTATLASIGGANARNVWTIATQPFSGAHFAVFPVEIPRRCILAGSKPGDTVLDPFAGAGTTLLVADRLGRDAIGIELNPEYARLIERRLTDDAPMFADVETVPTAAQTTFAGAI